MKKSKSKTYRATLVDNKDFRKTLTFDKVPPLFIHIPVINKWEKSIWLEFEDGVPMVAEIKDIVFRFAYSRSDTHWFYEQE